MSDSSMSCDDLNIEIDLQGSKDRLQPLRAMNTKGGKPMYMQNQIETLYEQSEKSSPTIKR